MQFEPKALCPGCVRWTDLLIAIEIIVEDETISDGFFSTYDGERLETWGRLVKERAERGNNKLKEEFNG